MNFKIVKQIMEHRLIQDTHDLAVLLVLAYHADEKGECFPSMNHIAREARLCDSRAARSIIKRLVAASYVTAKQGGGRGQRSHYRMHVEKGKRIEKGGSLNPVSQTPFSKPGLENNVLQTGFKNTDQEISTTKISTVVDVDEQNKQQHSVVVTGDVDDVIVVVGNGAHVRADEANHATSNATHHAAPPQPPAPASDLAQRLIEIGVTLDTANSLAREFPDRTAQQLDYLPRRRGLRNAAATIVNAIRQNWKAPPGAAPPSPSGAPATDEAPPVAGQPPEAWKAKVTTQKQAHDADAREGARLDALFLEMPEDEQGALMDEARHRIECEFPNIPISATALQMMRRTLLRERSAVE